MVIVVNGGRDGGVVVVPLSLGDSSVSVFVAEVRKELKEDLVLGHLTIDDFRVMAAVVETF